jgi:hypothetical protein
MSTNRRCFVVVEDRFDGQKKRLGEIGTDSGGCCEIVVGKFINGRIEGQIMYELYVLAELLIEVVAKL